MSSVTVDDTDPRFDYKDNAWTAGGETGEFGGTSHSSSTGGAMVTFGPFTGTSIAVFSTVGTRQTKVHFVLDGDSSSDLAAETNPSVEFQQEIFSTGGLDPTAQHTLAINLLDPGPFTLDYLRIGELGRSNTVQTSSLVSAPTTSTTRNTPVTTISASATDHTAISSVGDISSITSSSNSAASDSITSPSPSITPTTSELPSTLVGAGASPSLSVQSSPPPSSGASIPTSSSAISMSEDNTSGPDAVVIGSVTGAIAFFAIVVVSVLLFLRRRRKTMALQSHSGSPGKPSGAGNNQRPTLHLSIPSSLPFSRALHRPPLLPIHSSRSTPTPVKQADPFGASRPTPAFLAEDPNDSPVFDIKQRPVSGSTVTTRVTVGTTIGQRFSVPDSVYRDSNPDTPAPVPIPVPPIPILQFGKGSIPSPTETGASSTTGSPTRPGFGFGLTDFGTGTNQGGTVDTSIYSGYSENGLAPSASANSASRPLPHIPVEAKRAQIGVDRERDDGYAGQVQEYTYGHRHLPTTPSEAETFVHQDGGVRLASSIHTQPRRELPPPYQDYGI